MNQLRDLIEQLRVSLQEDDAHLFSNFPVGVPNGKERPLPVNPRRKRRVRPG